MTAAAPRVSIIVPTLAKTPLVLDCLRSIRRTVSRAIAYETLVVVNGGGAVAASRIAAEAPWARVLSAAVNLGFGGGCNFAARAALGNLLVFLNDDAEVEEGWLDALVSAADLHPDAGAIGSLVLFPDGKIQEAGSIVWRDGSTLGVARGLRVEAYGQREVRRVDYCSACSLLVRRAAWEAVGGFDARYYPAYYEDVDLCFAIRRLGWSVLFQPRSRLRHHETASSDERKRLFLVLRNRKIFVDKWSAELERREAAEPESITAVERAIALARGATRRVLFIDDRLPNRAIGSGFGLLFEAISELSQAGYALSFAATDEWSANADHVRDLGVEIVDEPLDQALARSDRTYCAVIVSRPHNFERHARAIRRRQPQAVLLYLAEALFHLRMQRRLTLLGSGAARELRQEADEMRSVEEAIAREADRIVSISVSEAEWLSAVDGGCPIETIVPTAPTISPTPQTFAERRGLLFVPGWLAGESSPNVDALDWCAREVLPRIAERIPWIRLDVTGGDPPASLRGLAGGRIRFLGRVEDLTAAYGAARVVVVPVRIGAGVKIKTIEAAQHGVPVVATEVGAEGLPADATQAIVVADDAATFAARVVDLYERPDVWQRQRSALIALVEKWRSESRMSWPRMLRRARARGPKAGRSARAA